MYPHVYAQINKNVADQNTLNSIAEMSIFLLTSLNFLRSKGKKQNILNYSPFFHLIVKLVSFWSQKEKKMTEKTHKNRNIHWTVNGELIFYNVQFQLEHFSTKIRLSDDEKKSW